MAAISHVRHPHAELTPVATDDLVDRLAALAADLFSADAATRAVERAFFERLLRLLTLTPHEIHDLAVAGGLGDLLPPGEPEAPAAPPRFADIPRWRAPK